MALLYNHYWSGCCDLWLCTLSVGRFSPSAIERGVYWHCSCVHSHVKFHIVYGACEGLRIFKRTPGFTCDGLYMRRNAWLRRLLVPWTCVTWRISLQLIVTPALTVLCQWESYSIVCTQHDSFITKWLSIRTEDITLHSFWRSISLLIFCIVWHV